MHKQSDMGQEQQSLLDAATKIEQAAASFQQAAASFQQAAASFQQAATSFQQAATSFHGSATPLLRIGEGSNVQQEPIAPVEIDRQRVGRLFAEVCANYTGADYFKEFERKIAEQRKQAFVKIVYHNSEVAGVFFRKMQERKSAEYWCVEIGGKAYLLPCPRDRNAFVGLHGFNVASLKLAPSQVHECAPAELYWDSSGERWGVRDPGVLREGTVPSPNTGSTLGGKSGGDAAPSPSTPAAAQIGDVPKDTSGETAPNRSVHAPALNLLPQDSPQEAATKCGALWFRWLTEYRAKAASSWETSDVFNDFCSCLPTNILKLKYCNLDLEQGNATGYLLSDTPSDNPLKDAWVVQIPFVSSKFPELAGMGFLVPSVVGKDQFGGLIPGFGMGIPKLEPDKVTGIIAARLVAPGGEGLYQIEDQGEIIPSQGSAPLAYTDNASNWSAGMHQDKIPPGDLFERLPMLIGQLFVQLVRSAKPSESDQDLRQMFNQKVNTQLRLMVNTNIHLRFKVLAARFSLKSSAQCFEIEKLVSREPIDYWLVSLSSDKEAEDIVLLLPSISALIERRRSVSTFSDQGGVIPKHTAIEAVIPATVVKQKDSTDSPWEISRPGSLTYQPSTDPPPTDKVGATASQPKRRGFFF